MIIDILTGIFALLLLLNTWVSWRAIHDDLATRPQRVAHILLIWTLPVLGALLVLHLQRQHLERSSGRYKDIVEPAEELGMHGRGHRRLEDGSTDASPD